MALLFETYEGDWSGQSGIYGVRWRGQTFTVGTVSLNLPHILTSISMYVDRVGSPGTMTLGIRAVNGGTVPVGSDLVTTTYNANLFPASPVAAWVSIPFTTALVLKPSTKYAICPRCPDGNSSNYVLWCADWTSPSYTGGSFVKSDNDGVDWTANTAYDHFFREYGDLIPEKIGYVHKIGTPSPVNIGLGL